VERGIPNPKHYIKNMLKCDKLWHNTIKDNKGVNYGSIG
jgi:hypothetical protein